jgi:hypothetical protein
MGRRTFSRSHRRLAGVVLVAFTLRALIPAGFMPSTEHGFTLSICPDGFPVELLATARDHAGHASHAQHVHHDSAAGASTGSHQHTSTDHCAFAAAAAAPRLADLPLVTNPVERGSLTEFVYFSPRPGTPRFLLAQPRAPPTFA